MKLKLMVLTKRERLTVRLLRSLVVTGGECPTRARCKPCDQSRAAQRLIDRLTFLLTTKPIK